METESDEAIEQGQAASVLRHLFGRDLLYLLLWGSQMAAASLITPIITRILGADRFGLVAVSMAVMQLLVAFGSLGLDNALQRQYALVGERAARRVMTLAMLAAVLVTAIAYMTGPIWSQAIGFSGFPDTLRYAVIWAGATAVTDAALALLRSRDQLRAFAAINLIQTAVSQVVSIALLLLVRRTAEEYIVGQMLTQLVAVALALAIVHPLPLRWRDRRLALISLGYSLPLVPASISGFMLGTSNRLFVQHDLGSSAVAHYTIAYNIGSIPMLILWALSVMWMPRVFALSHVATRAAVLAQSRDSIYVLLVPLVIGFSAAAPFLLRVWAPPSIISNDSVTVVIIILVTTVPYAAYLAHSRGLMALGATMPVAVATALGVLLNIGLNILLIPPFGIVGSGLATMLAYIVMHVVSAVWARGEVGLPMPAVGLTCALGLAIVIAFLFLLLPGGLPAVLLRSAVIAVSGLSGAAIVVTLMGHAERFGIAFAMPMLDAVLSRGAGSASSESGGSVPR